MLHDPVLLDDVAFHIGAAAEVSSTVLEVDVAGFLDPEH